MVQDRGILSAMEMLFLKSAS